VKVTRRSIPGRFLAIALALVVWTAGLPPCFAMDMDMSADMSAMAGHDCCEGEICPYALDDGASRPGSTPMPAADCCVLGSTPDPRPAAARVVISIEKLLPVTTVAARLWRAPVEHPARGSDGGPPPSARVARHLLLSVFLI
jgi:hypothetical protein